MWLINTETRRLVYVDNLEECEYAILSHTWGKEEVSFQDMSDISRARSKAAGFSKIQMTCKMACERGIAYAWIDTCCIDKSSSAELSEAINSMFRLYKRSKICFAYLSDLPSVTGGWTALTQCRWFTRGWTLQELIAPDLVELYDSAWKCIGNKIELCDKLAQRTGIPKEVLEGTSSLRKISVAARMAWAANRKTTRVEDRAYCLLGIFDINMPMLYGEGSKAFTRLQEEITKETNDMSLFAWQQQSQERMSAEGSSMQKFRGLFAESPDEFIRCDRIYEVYDSAFRFRGAFTMTNNGMHIETPLGKGPHRDFILNLYCSMTEDDGSQNWIGIRLTKTPNGFVRSCATELFVIPSIEYFRGEIVSCYIPKLLSQDESREVEKQYDAAFSFHYHTPPFCTVYLIDRQPARFWKLRKICVLLMGSTSSLAIFTFHFSSILGAP
jgi:hypothetical protein